MLIDFSIDYKHTKRMQAKNYTEDPQTSYDPKLEYKLKSYMLKK